MSNQYDKRETFNRMIQDARDGKIDMILTKSISRFSRNTVDCLEYTRELKTLNIAVFFEKENINTLDAKGEVLMTIMAALAQQESEPLSANVRLGLQFRNFVPNWKFDSMLQKWNILYSEHK